MSATPSAPPPDTQATLYGSSSYPLAWAASRRSPTARSSPVAASMSPRGNPSARATAQGRCRPGGGLVEDTPTLHQEDELGPSMVRVRREADEPALFEFVGDPLHGLAGQAHVARKMRNRQRDRRHRGRAPDLPSGAGQPEVANQGVACGEQAPVEAEDLQNQVRDSGVDPVASPGLRTRAGLLPKQAFGILRGATESVDTHPFPRCRSKSLGTRVAFRRLQGAELRRVCRAPFAPWETVQQTPPGQLLGHRRPRASGCLPRTF